MQPQLRGELPPLTAVIRREIEQTGPITMARFIELALYHPQLGYYSKGPNIGPRGDFTTSPEASPAFGRLLARHVAEIDALLGHPAAFNIIECGPGRGTLAKDLLATLATACPALYARLKYRLVEVSPALRAQQEAAILPDHAPICAWASHLEELPGGMRGALIANELVDALPVHMVENREGELREHYVDVAQEAEFRTIYGPLSDPRLAKFVQRYSIHLQPGERIEVNLAAEGWMREASRVLGAGVTTLIDYGDMSPNRYSAARREGTLLSYYGGAVTPHVLEHPGEQDITALVDFTALRDWAEEGGFTTLGNTRQASFLIGLGLGTTERAESGGVDVEGVLDYRRGLQALVSMEGLGRFHVLLLGSGVDPERARKELSGFKYAEVLT